MVRSPALYLSAALYAGCALLYFLSLGQMALSTAGPLFMVLGTLSTAVIGVLIFQENMGAYKLAGLAICLIGVATLMLSGE